jgi:N4-gp56 family major capsid protein
MALITHANPNTIANSIQRHYSKKFLDYIQQNLVLAPFAYKAPLPQRIGSKTLRLFRFGAAATAGVQGVTEGAAMSAASHRELTLDYIDVDLVQYVQSISISDVLDSTSLVSFLDQASKTNGEDAALHLDTIIRNEIKIHTSTVGNVNYATQNFGYAQAATDFAGVYNSGTYASTLTITDNDVLDAVTALKISNAPKIGGYYVAACAPEIIRDIQALTTNMWQKTTAASDKEMVYKGEVGRYLGARWIETTNAFRANTQGTYNAAGKVFSTFFFGDQAFGVAALDGMSPFAPKVYIVKGADKTDPANQIAAIVSFKTMYAAKLLQPKWICQLYTQTGYGNS